MITYYINNIRWKLADIISGGQLSACSDFNVYLQRKATIAQSGLTRISIETDGVPNSIAKEFLDELEILSKDLR